VIKAVTDLLMRRYPRSLDLIRSSCVNGDIYLLVFFKHPIRAASLASLQERILDQNDKALTCKVLTPDPENRRLLLIIITR